MTFANKIQKKKNNSQKNNGIKILLSGVPKVGKTTLLSKIIEDESKNVMGCIVKELSRNSMRYGFAIETIPHTKETLLASAEVTFSDHFVGRFSVNIDAINNELIPFMYQMLESKTAELLIFDEIGRMQNLSPAFIGALNDLMTTDKPLIATIVHDDEPWARAYKENPIYFMIQVTPENRTFLTELVPLMVDGAKDYASLNHHLQSQIVTLFKTFMAASQWPEVLKMFTHTISYLANGKAQYNPSLNCYDVCGTSKIRNVSLNEDKKWLCTCDFHQSSPGRMCSHIQTVSLLESCCPQFL